VEATVVDLRQREFLVSASSGRTLENFWRQLSPATITKRRRSDLTTLERAESRNDRDQEGISVRVERAVSAALPGENLRIPMASQEQEERSED